MSARSLMVAAALVGAGGAAIAGCGDPRPVSQACKRDGDCAAGAACLVGTCIPRLMGGAQTWAVEMMPRTESAWAITENTAVSFSEVPVSLKVERTVTVEGTLTGADVGATGAGAVRVVITVTSPIDRRDLSYEGRGATRAGAGVLEFSVRVPESAIGRQARFRIIPDPPADRTLPVWTTQPAALARTVTVPAPTIDQIDTVEGVLETPFVGEAVAGYLVRAVLGNRLVSNVERTTADGRFRLRLPRAPFSDAKLSEVTIELAPSDPMMAAPKLTVKLTAETVAKVTDGKLNLGTLRLPPTPPVQVYDIPVIASDPARKDPIAGVTLRFQTAVPGAQGAGAQATYLREAQTDKDGVAHVPLLPGNAGETRTYSVAVIPGPTSDFAARCVNTYGVAPASGQMRVSAAIPLLAKVQLDGTIVDQGSFASPGVTVTAVRTDAVYFEQCGSDVTVAPPSIVTKDDGSYRLMLEPGRYRIEYEPQVGSPSALLLEDDVLIDTSQRRTVMLPAGVLGEGSVANPDGGPVVGCEVRVLDPPRDAAMPRQRRGRALTGADGRFQIVLPMGTTAVTSLP
jgi:hypothetical protein